jgi:hypothetical protein
LWANFKKWNTTSSKCPPPISFSFFLKHQIEVPKLRTWSFFTSTNGILVMGAEQSSKFRMEFVGVRPQGCPKDEDIKRVRTSGVWFCGKV